LKNLLRIKLSQYHILIIIIALGPLLNSLDSTMVTIALPTITRSFQINTGTASWLVISYFLVLSSVLLAFGKLGDIIGFKKIFMSGLAVFTIGSILCTIAPDFYLLIAFAIIQALGAAMILAVSSAMVSTFLPSNIRGMALGYVSTVTMLGVAVAPLIGGMITTYLGWRWIFLINVPIGICAIIAGKYMLPTDVPSSPNQAFDIIGTLLILLCISSLTYALSAGDDKGWSSPFILALFATFLILLAVFVAWERRQQQPLVNLHLFDDRTFTYANIASLLFMLVVQGLIFLMPFYLELVKGLQPDFSGLILSALALAMVVAAPIGGSLSDRHGSRKICFTTSLVILIGMILVASFGIATSLAFIVISLAFMGLGVGGFSSPNVKQILEHAPSNEQGVASSLFMTGRRMGSLFGIAIFESLFSGTVLANLKPGETIFDASPHLLISGFHLAFMAGVLICVAISIFALASRD
jgi:EmrB/QacA subfamily drug resistance transporter